MAIIIILITLILVALLFAFSGLIFWGIGAFIVWAFAIPFTWTFWHGLAVAFIVNTLTGIFSSKVKIGD